MEKEFYPFAISVDTETGIYWYGERKLRTQAQINAAIKLAVENQSNVHHHTSRGQSLFLFAAMNLIRKLGSCLGAKSFRFN